MELFSHFMDRFIRESFVCGKVGTFNQEFRPNIADKKFKVIRKELTLSSSLKIYEFMEEFKNYMKAYKGLMKKNLRLSVDGIMISEISIRSFKTLT